MIEDLLEMRRARLRVLASRKKRMTHDGKRRDVDLAQLAATMTTAISAMGREDIGIGSVWATPHAVLATLAKGGAREVCAIPLDDLAERPRVLVALSAGIVRLNRSLSATSSTRGDSGSNAVVPS